MRFAVEVEREVDGRWIAEVPSIPGAMGTTREEAVAQAQALALGTLADRFEAAIGILKRGSITCDFQ